MNSYQLLWLVQAFIHYLQVVLLDMRHFLWLFWVIHLIFSYFVRSIPEVYKFDLYTHPPTWHFLGAHSPLFPIEGVHEGI
jgi:hypothetical protein